MTRRALFAAGGVLLLLLVLAGAACWRPGDLTYIYAAPRRHLFIGLECVAAAFYCACAWLVLRLPPGRRGLVLVLGLAAAMRVAPLALPPFLSSDLFRYVWDGRVQAAGINPYLYIPSNPALAPLRDEEIYEHTNRTDTAPTIYPPAAQLLFAAVGRVWPHALGIKAAMALLEAVAVGAVVLLLRRAGLPGERIAIYAWNPLPIWEYAGNGHVDAAAMAFIALALLALAARRQAVAGMLLAVAVLCKFLPLAVAPAFWRRWDWRFAGSAVLTVAALYGVYAGAGRNILGFLPGYAAEEGLGSGSGFMLLRVWAAFAALPGWAGRGYMVACGLGLAGLAAWCALGPALPADPAVRIRIAGRQATVLAMATTLALTPHYPWYLGWLGLLACLAPYRSVVLLSAAGVLLYLDPDHDETTIAALVYGPPLALAIADIISAARMSRAARTEFKPCPPRC